MIHKESERGLVGKHGLFSPGLLWGVIHFQWGMKVPRLSPEPSQFSLDFVHQIFLINLV